MIVGSVAGRLSAVALLVAVVAGSCGGAPSASPTTQMGEDLAVSVGTLLGTEGASPFDPMFRAVPDPAGQVKAFEEVVATCMLAEGFDFRPTTENIKNVYDPNGDPPFLSAGWSERYGFGVTTLAVAQMALRSDLVGVPDEMFRGVGSAAQQQRYIAGLTDLEFRAYHSSLYGFGPGGADLADSDFFRDRIRNSDACYFRGLRETRYANPIDRFGLEFAESIQQVADRVAADPRTIAWERRIAECVMAEGVAFESARSFEARTEQELSELVKTIERLRHLPSGEVALNRAYDRLGALQDLEREIAVASLECGGGPLDRYRDLAHVYAEFEAELARANRSAILDLADW